eukprot:scaffold1054_cov366-Prasinococcus_capsulatus_cf.AAC.2
MPCSYSSTGPRRSWSSSVHGSALGRKQAARAHLQEALPCGQVVDEALTAQHPLEACLQTRRAAAAAQAKLATTVAATACGSRNWCAARVCTV